MPIYFFGNIRLKHQRFSLHCNYFCRVCFILRGHSYSCEFKHIKCMCFYQTAERENRRFEVKIVQSRPTLCNPMDYTVHGILQARILEWVAVSFSRASSHPRDGTQVSPALQTDLYQLNYQGSIQSLSRVQLFETS